MLGDKYRIVEYDNGPDALNGLARSLPDLVLLDISLPGMDGNEILSEIRRDGRMRHLPVIALTAHAMAGDRERFLDAGFNDYITKPIVDESLLVSAIERWLSGG
jgi:CheY-like chemotaxis protein